MNEELNYYKLDEFYQKCVDGTIDIRRQIKLKNRDHTKSYYISFLRHVLYLCKSQNLNLLDILNTLKDKTENYVERLIRENYYIKGYIQTIISEWSLTIEPEQIFDKMNEFGIKDTTKKNKGFNLLNPLSWFSGQAQGAIDQAEKGKGLFGNSLTGRMLEKKRALAEAQGYNKGGLVGKGGNGMKDLAPAADGSILRVSSNVKDYNKDHFGTTGYRLGQVNPRTLVSGRTEFTDESSIKSNTKKGKLGGLKNFLFNRDYDKFTFDDSEIGLTKYTENVRKTMDGETFTSSKTYRSESASIGVPDLIEHQDQLLKQIPLIKRE